MIYEILGVSDRTDFGFRWANRFEIRTKTKILQSKTLVFRYDSDYIMIVKVTIKIFTIIIHYNYYRTSTKLIYNTDAL